LFFEDAARVGLEGGFARGVEGFDRDREIAIAIGIYKVSVTTKKYIV
jgi:hypothetical protein